MEKFKIINNFNVSSNATKGTYKQCIICPNCNNKIFIENKSKLTYSKIKTIFCSSCNYAIKLGNIFNFTTGNRLNNRLEDHDQQTYDNYIWESNYDKI